MNLFELTRRLVDIPSVTGDEAAIGNFLASYLKELGYRVEQQEVAPGRANVLAAGNSADNTSPEIVLSTHMDTVPPYFPSADDGQSLSGRGSCDAKGIIAAQICAAEKLRKEGISNIGLLFTIDEEAGSLGARVANWHNWASGCSYLVNGEPTNNQLAIGSKGSLRVRLETSGRPAHSAYPEQGESAIDKMIDVLREVQAVDWPVDAFFGQTTCNIGLMGGGTAANVIPAHAWAELQIRLVSPSTEVLSILERLVTGRASLQCLSITEPVRMTPIADFEQTVVSFTTDIPHLGRWGTPLLMGPGSILMAHTAEERVAKAELAQAVNQYVRLVRILKTRIMDETP